MAAYLTLIAVLLIAGAFLLLVVVHLMARALVRPPRMTDGKAMYVLGRLTPRDVGLRFESLTFVVEDATSHTKLKLAAWWMPTEQASTKTVVLVHGYADAKVGALAWAPLWNEMGFNILAVDLRAHGDSEGTLCTGGFAERQDLLQVVHQLLALKASATEQVVLFGVSFGAAAVAGAAVLMEADSTNRTETARGGMPIHAVVMESPFADFRSASMSHFGRVGLPQGFVGRLALRHSQWLTHATYEDVKPVSLIKQVPCPLLVLAAGEDVYVSPAEAAEMRQAVEHRPQQIGPSIYRQFEGVEHLMAVVSEPQAYRAQLQEFLNSALANDLAVVRAQ